MAKFNQENQKVNNQVNVKDGETKDISSDIAKAKNELIKELQLKVATQAETINGLFSDIDALKENGYSECNNTAVTLTTNTRLELLKSLMPQIGLEYPRHNAQKAEEAVKEVMEVWGLAD